jgi:antitoxin VapB
LPRTKTPRTAKLFRNGRSQAVRLPAEFRFEGKEVFIRKDDRTGDVILSRRSASWETFRKLREEALLHEKEAVEKFLSDRKDESAEDRELLENSNDLYIANKNEGRPVRPSAPRKC